jgi:ornithine carbamoyltransferase
MMSVKHFLSLEEIGADALAQLVSHSMSLIADDDKGARPLQGKNVGIYFRGTSTRTRTAFTVGALRLGAGTISYGSNDLQVVTGETIQDTARVLSNFLDALVIRTNATLDEMRLLSQQDDMAVINAMSESEHPTQAVGDLVTIREEFGRLSDIHVLYVGEGNNTAAALALAVAQTPGMRLTIVTPEGYGLPEMFISRASSLAEKHKAAVEQHHNIDGLPPRVDVVYTTRWQTMGVPKAESNWREKFMPYSVTPELMTRVSKPGSTIFMHDLPAVRGDDVLDEVLDGPQSRAFRQARHKLTSAMSILAWCLDDKR